MAERWQEIARELGSWDIEDVGVPYNSYRDMVNQEGRSYVGEYVESQPACGRIAALEAEVAGLKEEVERLRESLEVVRGEIDHMFHSVESFTPGWLARIRNAVRKALGDA